MYGSRRDFNDKRLKGLLSPYEILRVFLVLVSLLKVQKNVDCERSVMTDFFKPNIRNTSSLVSNKNVIFFQYY